MSRNLQVPLNCVCYALQDLHTNTVLLNQFDCLVAIEIALQNSQAMVNTVNELPTIRRHNHRNDKVVRSLKIL